MHWAGALKMLHDTPSLLQRTGVPLRSSRCSRALLSTLQFQWPSRARSVQGRTASLGDALRRYWLAAVCIEELSSMSLKKKRWWLGSSPLPMPTKHWTLRPGRWRCSRSAPAVQDQGATRQGANSAGQLCAALPSAGAGQACITSCMPLP